MIFGSDVRYEYSINPLVEVICQLRFPAILSIGAREPIDFQEAVRADFPRYSLQEEQAAPKVVNGKVEVQPKIRNYSFISEDGRWKLNLTQNFIALSTVRYGTWEEFAAKLDKPLAEFIEIYRPAFFERAGLRYVNAFSRSACGLAGTPWSELIASEFLGILAAEDVDETEAARATVDADWSLGDGIRLKLHSGPGLIQRPGQKERDPEPKFILDGDFSVSGDIKLPDISSRLEAMHAWSTRLIRGAVLDKLDEALR